MRLVLFQPDIPQNTGTILRLAACLSVAVDIIGPAGFDWSDKAMRRAGLDYLDFVAIQRHVSWDQFLADHRSDPAAGRLVLGRESGGVPDAVHQAADHCVTVPMAQGRRSLNVAVAAAMVIGEALRQTGGFSTGPLT